MYYDWPVKNAIVNLPIKLKGNLNCISSNLFSSLGNQNKGIGTAFQMLLTGIRLPLLHRLGSIPIKLVLSPNLL